MAVKEAVPHVLVVAGTDSSGGAGISRDVETLAAFGVRACLAVTAVTAQTDGTVERIEAMPPVFVESQMRAALAGGLVRAVKLGMLASADSAQSVCRLLEDHLDLPAVVDPVLVSSSGRALMRGDAAAAYERLWASATIITPNLSELAVLTGRAEARDDPEALDQARQLVSSGARAVLVKGGHSSGIEAVDLLVTAETVMRFAAPRLSVSMRGTGCALASAIAAGLARGTELSRSVSDAKAHVHRNLASLC